MCWLLAALMWARISLGKVLSWLARYMATPAGTVTVGMVQSSERPNGIPSPAVRSVTLVVSAFPPAEAMTRQVPLPVAGAM